MKKKKGNESFERKRKEKWENKISLGIQNRVFANCSRGRVQAGSIA